MSLLSVSLVHSEKSPDLILPYQSLENSSDLTSRCFAACEADDFAQVKAALIQNSFLLSQPDDQGRTLFLICAAKRQLANMQWLFEQDSSVLKQVTPDGRSAMHIAAEQGDFEIIEWLDQSNKKLIQQPDKNRFTPLHLAAFHEHIVICKIFIEQIKSNPKLIEQIAQGKCVKTLALLLERGVDPNTENSFKQTLLHLAAEAGQEKNVVCLIQYGAEINAQDSNGETPLHKAVWGEPKLAVVRLLLENGANPVSKTQYGDTPLHWAAKHGHCQSAKFIGYEASEVLNANKHYPFDLAIQFGQDDFIHFILGTQTRLKLDVSSSEDIEGFYFECLQQAKKQNLIEEQILYLLKLSAFYIEKAENSESNMDQLLLIGAKILNCAVPLLGDQHPLFKNYLLRRLEEIEKRFLKSQGIKAEVKKDAIQEMRSRLSEIRKTAADSHKDGKPIQEILQQLTCGFKTILSQLIAETQELLGLPPVKWACIGMGSMSREEMCPYSGIEFAFLIAKDHPQAFEYFRTLSKILELKIINLGETKFSVFGDAYDSPIPNGFCLDTGGNTPLGIKGVYELIGTPKQLAQFQSIKWMERNIILSNTMSNVCWVAGSEQLKNKYNAHKRRVQQLQEKKERMQKEKYSYEKLALSNVGLIAGRKQSKNKHGTHKQKIQKLQEKKQEMQRKNYEELALRLLGGCIIEFSPRFSKEKETAFEVKKELYRPFQEILGCLALLYNLKETTTLNRIDKLVKLNVFSSQGAQNLKEAINRVLSLRLQTHLFYKDEKEFLCYPEEGKPLDLNLYYFNEENIKDLHEIYRTLFPFQKGSEEFFTTRNKKSLNQNLFYDDSPLARGRSLIQTKQYEQAQIAFQEAVSLNPNHAEALLAMGNIKGVTGDAYDQLDLNQRALELVKKFESGDLFFTYMSIASALESLERYQEALEYLEEGLKKAIQVYGKQHPQTVIIYAQIGHTLLAFGDYQKSLTYNRKVLLMIKRFLREESIYHAQIYRNIGHSLFGLGEIKRSLKYFEKALAFFLRLYGENHPLVADIYASRERIFIELREIGKTN